MEKLIELLNEYEEKVKKSDNIYYRYDEWWLFFIEEYEVEWDKYKRKLYVHIPILISKSFWFIKWLVDNDKIDFKKFDGYSYNYLENPIWSDNYDTVRDYKTIIQWLSISDTPIEDLISYLK